MGTLGIFHYDATDQLRAATSVRMLTCTAKSLTSATLTNRCLCIRSVLRTNPPSTSSTSAGSAVRCRSPAPTAAVPAGHLSLLMIGRPTRLAGAAPSSAFPLSPLCSKQISVIPIVLSRRGRHNTPLGGPVQSTRNLL